MTKRTTSTSCRSAITGRYVTPKYAATHKKTTITRKRQSPNVANKYSSSGNHLDLLRLIGLGGENRRPILSSTHKNSELMINVTSTNLRAVDYDPRTYTLTVDFRNNRRYQYHGVPSNMFQQLLHSASKGHFFSTFIRGHFPTIRIL